MVGHRGGGGAGVRKKKRPGARVPGGHTERPLTAASSTTTSWKSGLPAQPRLGTASREAAARSLTSKCTSRSSGPRSSPPRAT